MKTRISLLSALILAGCASTGVVPTDAGKYMLTKKSAGGLFISGEEVKADLYAEANTFCAAKGMAVETITVEALNAIPFVRTSQAKLHFRCAPAGG